MRRRFVEMIDREAEHARAGREGRITAKFNGLADREMIAALYRASQAGVHVELLVRGICSLRPGVAGLSERIHVYSALGRYLEHARIFRFDNAGAPEYYIGSADWRTRNLSRRVEVAVPIRDPGPPRAAGRHPGRATWPARTCGSWGRTAPTTSARSPPRARRRPRASPSRTRTGRPIITTDP